MSTILDVPEGSRFYCYFSCVDMPKGVKSHYNLVKTESNLPIVNGDLFIFISSNRKAIKILRWQKNGFALFSGCVL